MESLKYKVAIIGAGNLGRRYLEGILKSRLLIELYVIDINERSLILSKEIYDLNRKSEIVFFTSTSISQLPNHIDLVIVSTTSNNRHLIIKNILKNTDVDHWILEKVLSNSIESLDQIELLINKKNNSKAWVNTFFRTLDWFKNIKNSIEFEKLEIQVSGGNWGIACNTVHFIDFVEWLTEEKLIEINTSTLEKKWFNSKRDGYFEVNGKLILNFTKGTILNLISDNSNDQLQIKISYKDYELIIYWEDGIAKSNNGQEFLGRITYQSEMTASLVDNILLNGSSELPELQSSIEIHKKFISSMINHWNFVHNEAVDLIPIT